MQSCRREAVREEYNNMTKRSYDLLSPERHRMSWRANILRVLVGALMCVCEAVYAEHSSIATTSISMLKLTLVDRRVPEV